MSRKLLIPAAAYLRKSTKGKGANGKERQEKSLPTQRREIEKFAAANGYRIVRWYQDEGISGWKRGDDRPGFAQMIADAKSKRDFTAVICDDLDRFSRAEVDETQADIYALKSAGVDRLHCVNQGLYSLGSRGDLGEILKLIIGIYGSNEFSRKLGRRLAVTRRNEAEKGNRTGGRAPYGYRNKKLAERRHTIEPDPDTAPIVQAMFQDFANGARSIRSIATDLNRRGVLTPRHGQPKAAEHWSGATVRHILRNPVYVGTFTYNRTRPGQFYFVDDAGEVREASERTQPGWKLSDVGAFVVDGTHDPLIDKALFDRVQEKLKANRKRPGQPREGGYPLTGVLFCGHCGCPMYGGTRRGVRLYECGSTARKGTCPHYSVKEADVLPFVLGMLRQELGRVEMQLLATKPRSPAPNGELNRLRKREAELTALLDRAKQNLARAASDDVFKMIQEDVLAMLAERKEVAGQIEAATAPTDEKAAARQRLEQVAWLKRQTKNLVKVWPKPIQPLYVKAGDCVYVAGALDRSIRWEVPVVREQLRECGTRVDLFFREEPWGKRMVYRVDKIRYQLGKFSGTDSAKFCKVPLGARCTGTRGGGRCGSRRGRG